MDLGTSTYTDFKMDESVAGYIAENFELFGCDMSLIHSHNNFSCFFSGTDQSTLQSEGNDQNCFVSLIVNNAGKYCAAITRKVQEKKTIVTKNYSSTYEFFGEGEKTSNVLTGASEETTVDNTYIEYFMLDVEIEHVDNPLAYLDTRFDEIQKKKRKSSNQTAINPTLRTFGSDFDEDYSFYKWQKDKQDKDNELPLFSKEEMDETIDSWEPDPNIIHRFICQMLTCSLIISENTNLEQWIYKWMLEKYDELFADKTQFNEWKEFIIDFLLNQYMLMDEGIPTLDYDLVQCKVADAMYNELCQYYPDGSNQYIEDYKEVLTRYIYE